MPSIWPLLAYLVFLYYIGNYIEAKASPLARSILLSN